MDIDEVHNEPCCSCLRQYDPRTHPEEFVSVLAMGLTTCGIIISTFAYGVPRDYTFDPDLPARTMESIEIYYANLGYKLDLSILIGLSFIAMGGILFASLLTYNMIKGHFYSCMTYDPDTVVHYSRNRDHLYYGSLDH